MIGKLLGHRKIQTTARYAHLARDSVRESADLVAASIAADILPRPAGSAHRHGRGSALPEATDAAGRTGQEARVGSIVRLALRHAGIVTSPRMRR